MEWLILVSLQTWNNIGSVSCYRNILTEIHFRNNQLSGLITLSMNYPLQAASCCHNSRVVLDEHDIEVGANEKNVIIKADPWKTSVLKHVSVGN